MKITKVTGREIYNSRGLPAIECELTINGEISVVSSVPSGASCSEYEAHELVDGGNRLVGRGVQHAISILENKIGPMLIGKEPGVVEMDLAMIDMDGTENKTKLGGNTMLAASIAVLKAQAAINGMNAYEFIADLCEFESVTLPYPMVNIINGGMHADNNLLMQEFMVMPIGAESFRAGFELVTVVFHELKKILQEKGLSTCVGDEGGFAPQLDSDEQALELIVEAIKRVGGDAQEQLVIALDVAASTFYDEKKKVYNWHGKKLTADNMIELYAMLAGKYSIYSIEDGLHYADWQGWQNMTSDLGEALQLVGDDLFATNPARIVHGLEQEAANAAVIKPNQIGTVTETLQAVKLCKEYGLNTVVSHRSGETNDTFIVDLAVGTAAGQIKAGGCSRGERMAKYNQLLRIEDDLTLSLMDV